MATFSILSNNAPQFEIEVRFADQVFPQAVIFQEQGTWLNVAMQTYADRYEADWLAAQAPAAEAPAAEAVAEAEPLAEPGEGGA